MGSVGTTTGGFGRAVTSIEFSLLSRRLCEEARAEGYDAPQFRSPPRRPGVDRSLSRRPDGSCVVSIRLRERPMLAVAGDMIDGVLAANRVKGAVAGRLRDQLWSVAEDHLLPAAHAEPPHPAHVRAAA